MNSTHIQHIDPASFTLSQFITRHLAVSGLFIALLLLVITASLISEAFLSPINLVNVFRQVALYGIVGIGLTLVILTAGIDLSVGSIVAVVSVSAAMMLNLGWPVSLVIAAGLGIGLVFGVVNGVGITLCKIPPFIMTLGSMVMLRGLALTLADGRPIDVTSSDFGWLGRGSALGVPVAVWIFLLVSAGAFFILRYTAFGRNVYAVGSNAEAARLSGINVNLVKLGVYMISGALTGLTALIFVSRLSVGEPTAGAGLELEAIAIAVIGGTSLFGGVGGIIGTTIGVCILAVLANLMNLVGISPFTQQIVKGAIIIVAVSFEVLRRRR